MEQPDPYNANKPTIIDNNSNRPTNIDDGTKLEPEEKTEPGTSSGTSYTISNEKTTKKTTVTREEVTRREVRSPDLVKVVKFTFAKNTKFELDFSRMKSARQSQVYPLEQSQKRQLSQN